MARRRVNNNYTIHNQVSILSSGADFFGHITHMAATATHTLHLQTYIFEQDETGHQVAQELIAAAARGVQVYLLVDGYASRSLTTTFIDSLKQGGVHVGFFEPFFKGRSFYFGRRMHHKLVVADAASCLVGGRNIGNRYNDFPSAPAWMDWALYVQGQAAAEIHKVCVSMWNRSVFRAKCSNQLLHKPLPSASVCKVRIRRNDWVYRRTEVLATYRQLLAQAQSEVVIMTSYFWPPDNLLRRMERAAARGVRIRLILTGYADVPLAKYAERYLYDRLFRSGIEVYEYQRNVLHGKIAVADARWLTCGSYNVNNISQFASVELNLDVDNQQVAQQLRTRLDSIMATDCLHIIPPKGGYALGVWRTFVCALAYWLVHFLFFMFTFYFSQRRVR